MFRAVPPAAAGRTSLRRLEFAAFSVKSMAMTSGVTVSVDPGGADGLSRRCALAAGAGCAASGPGFGPDVLGPAATGAAGRRFRTPDRPAMNLAPPSGPGSIPSLPAPLTQPTIVQPSIATVPPVVPPPGASTASQAVLSLTARYGKDLPVINSGLVWRVFADKPDDTGTFKLIREERGATPNIVLPPGSYVVHVALGLVSAVRAVSLKVGDRSRVLRASGRRPAHRGPRRHQQDSAEPDFVRALQGQPVRRRRRARVAGAQRRRRRRRAAAGGDLLHHLQLRRRQLGGALRYPRPGRQADGRDRHPSRAR